MIVSTTEKWLGRALLIFMMLVTIVPFISLFITALHEPGTYPSGLSLPEEPHWENFLLAFNAANMPALLWSSILIELGVVPVAIIIATLAGFALGHLRPVGGRIVFIVFLLGLTLPFEGIIVPLYYQIRDMGLLNTRWAIILPLIGLFMPFAVTWMRAHFVNMPQDLSEAARMDGANTWQLFWRIHVPLSMPAISSLAILLFLWTWNQFLLAIVLVDDP
ncbi:MAG: carbohydrate ABC transporter permease, partial [Micrococcales bacterium]|nr:carbohydrate ABC transporter permease [Micrococcales bacterium]